jgi:hypothetical protein
LSSAILYLAIVAIWAVVLVPRWLRPRSAPAQPVPVPAEPADAEWREAAGPGEDAGLALSASAGGPDAAGEPAAGAADPGDEDVADAGERPAAAEPEVTTVSAPATRRAEVLKARRRLLTTLVTLAVIAAALVVTRIDAYWIVVPPVALLAGYLGLLRKFARIDAERAHRVARIRRAEARAGAGQEQAPSGETVPAAPPAAPEPELAEMPGAQPYGAEIIDISGRIGDQVYDQYSDAANRAVGD